MPDDGHRGWMRESNKNETRKEEGHHSAISFGNCCDEDGCDSIDREERREEGRQKRERKE